MQAPYKSKQSPVTIFANIFQEECMSKRNLLLAAVCLLSLSAAVLADEVKLKNGDRLTGTIIKADAKTLTLKTDYAGAVTISTEAIAEVVSKEPLYVALSDGKTLVGKVATSSGKYEVETKDAGKASGEMSAVQAIRSQPEQTAYERMQNPSWLDLWNGGLDFGYSLTTGNTRTNTWALGSNLSRQTRRDKTTLYAAYINAKNKNKGVTETTANAIRGGGRYEVSLTNRMAAFGFADFEYNQIQLLDLRSVLGGGLGYYAVKNDRAQLQIFGGGAYNRENFSTGLKRNSAEVFAGEEFSLKVSDRVLFKERFQVFPNMTNRGEYRHTFDSSLTTKLTGWMTWNVTTSNRYISNPPPGSKNNDLLLTTGIGVSFTNFNFRK
jgi:putative salt-induced outer membrane protein YdiY